ncbi:PAS fold protein [Botrimarina mediterranea]|uniref:PAS fold protein n=2 Tax=Botrimarina mediterranea TaxID=2528022 RepID=A0A518KCU1_9BACT|nr:PAS fold protein [Botrimarina mediterranea]
MKSIPPMQRTFGPLLASLAAKLTRLVRPRDWRYQARASELLDAVLATASDSVFFVDSRGKVRDCNLVAEQIFGRDRSEMIGRGIALYVPSLAFSALRRRAKGMGHDSLSLEMPGRLETLATDSSGSTFPVSVAVRSLSVWGNKGCLVRLRDDSRREADRQEIRRLTDQLAIAKRALEHFNAASVGD